MPLRSAIYRRLSWSHGATRGFHRKGFHIAMIPTPFGLLKLVQAKSVLRTVSPSHRKTHHFFVRFPHLRRCRIAIDIHCGPNVGVQARRAVQVPNKAGRAGVCPDQVEGTPVTRSRKTVAEDRCLLHFVPSSCPPLLHPLREDCGALAIDGTAAVICLYYVPTFPQPRNGERRPPSM